MPASQDLYIASDHAGYALKSQVVAFLAKNFPEIKVTDCGCESESSVHYPDYAAKVANEVGKGKGRGILICGSGIGMCISANKVAGVRAASAWDATSARLCREHNDANIVCIGSRLTGWEVVADIVQNFLNTKFAGGRHQLRIDLIQQLESAK